MRTYHYGRTAVFVLLSLAFFTNASYAKSAREIDASVDEAMVRFEKEVFAAKDLLKKAKGVLVFPKVYKGGIGIGAEYGVGALRINGKTVDYYNTMGGSFGFQLGGQVRSIYLLFMEDSALKSFQSSEGWKAGVDGSVALITIGADGSIDTTKNNEPIVAFVLGQKGLMYNLTLEGSKYNKIRP
ncbi:MAG TPA: YSC84-related protein [bacterium]|nr:YSC84-related protein [bacterium]